MADNQNISQIKLPNGSTYDIKDNTSGYTSNIGTITSVKTTAGAHTTINVSSGAANFNVPTKTSHLTNDSGFLTSSDLASVLTYKGTKASVADVIAISNPKKGDVWHVTADGSEYAWDGATSTGVTYTLVAQWTKNAQQWVQIGGTWKEVVKMWVQIGGAWKEVTNISINKDGTWKT